MDRPSIAGAQERTAWDPIPRPRGCMHPQTWSPASFPGGVQTMQCTQGHASITHSSCVSWRARGAQALGGPGGRGQRCRAPPGGWPHALLPHLAELLVFCPLARQGLGPRCPLRRQVVQQAPPDRRAQPLVLWYALEGQLPELPQVDSLRRELPPECARSVHPALGCGGRMLLQPLLRWGGKGLLCGTLILALLLFWLRSERMGDHSLPSFFLR